MLAKITEDQLIDCCAAGMPVGQIAEQFRLSRQAIHQRLQKLGIFPPAKKTIRRYYSFNIETLAMIDELKIKDETVNDVIKKAVENLYLDQQDL